MRRRFFENVLSGFVSVRGDLPGLVFCIDQSDWPVSEIEVSVAVGVEVVAEKQ